MKALIKCSEGFIWYWIKDVTIEDHMWSFEVYESCTLTKDDNETIEDLELYVAGSIKWDGCSHVWFGEKDQNEKRDGYLHLCGKQCWVNHSKVMSKLWDLAASKIKSYDKSIAEL